MKEIWRLRWVIAGVLAGGLILIFRGDAGVFIRLVSGIFRLFIGFLVSHVLWESFFPYFHLGQTYNSGGDWKEIARFRAVFIAAWLLAFALVIG